MRGVAGFLLDHPLLFLAGLWGGALVVVLLLLAMGWLVFAPRHRLRLSPEAARLDALRRLS